MLNYDAADKEEEAIRDDSGASGLRIWRTNVKINIRKEDRRNSWRKNYLDMLYLTGQPGTDYEASLEDGCSVRGEL